MVPLFLACNNYRLSTDLLVLTDPVLGSNPLDEESDHLELSIVRRACHDVFKGAVRSAERTFKSLEYRGHAGGGIEFSCSFYYSYGNVIFG